MKTDIKNKTEIIIKTIQHKPHMSEGVGSWGNGYLEIPKEHFAYDYLICYIDDWGFNGSLCNEDITYHREFEDGIVIGFDTLHSYNNESHNEKWVLAKCNEIKDYLSSPERLKEVINLTLREIDDSKMKIKKLKNKLKKLRE
tara:strand:- start:626 stop:1051 length:426 start_codon:yes stop_codon:yes gene_type:complete